MSEPLAYLLTWTCYGTWPHGDARGSVDDEHRTFGRPFLPPDPIHSRRDQSRLRHPPIKLTEAQRRIVTDTIAAHCRRRNWELLAVNARSNHVHAVVAAGDVLPERVLSELKAWCTRRLREAGQFAPTARVWTHHGSTRYLWNEANVESAITYVLERQDDSVM